MSSSDVELQYARINRPAASISYVVKMYICACVNVKVRVVMVRWCCGLIGVRGGGEGAMGVGGCGMVLWADRSAGVRSEVRRRCQRLPPHVSGS